MHRIQEPIRMRSQHIMTLSTNQICYDVGRTRMKIPFWYEGRSVVPCIEVVEYASCV